MVAAHLAWLRTVKKQDPVACLTGLSPEASRLVLAPPALTDWILFRELIEIDRAIARVVGGVEDVVFRSLGHNSAVVNLQGAYKTFLADEPHRFFQQTALMHRQWQTFGTARYERTGERTLRLHMEGYLEFSPVYCASALGYYEGAVQTMGATGPIHLLESQCQCAGDRACVFELGW